MICLVIDGKRTEVPEGATIMEAAQSLGIYIPGLCAHPDLPAAGVCGLCLVEVAGQPEPVKACTTPVAPGMVIRTETEAVKQRRREALKQILATHPHACLTCTQREGCSRTQCSSNVPENERCCPKLGNCEVQKVAEYSGIPEGVPRYVYRNLPVIDTEPLIRRDYNLCIACTRCVRVCQDLRGVGALGVVYRGAERFIGYTAPDAAQAACRFCGACVEVCPTGALMDKDGRGKARDEYLVPCRSTCPAGVDVPRYVRLIAEGRFAEALAVVRERVPFPAVLGYVCAHPCEAACRRGEVNEAVAVQALKRAAAEHGQDGFALPAPKPASGKKVAVVGAGPAGLTCAYYLSQKGHAVTVYEAMPEPGGMMRYGIPDYRLPKEILAGEVGAILARGIDFRAGVAVGRDVSLEELTTNYDAVFLAVGAAASRRLSLEGAELAGVHWGVEFLREVNAGRLPAVGERVVVVGGGNVAVDTARTALRLGAKEVAIIYRRTREKMPAHAWEVAEAEEEGIAIHTCLVPQRLLGENGRVVGLECIEIDPEQAARGEFTPKALAGAGRVFAADTVILAVGQAADLGFLEGALRITPQGTIEVNSSLETSRPGVFAAGDVVSGPATVIEAIAGGRQAAASIDRYLGGDGDIDEVLAPVEEPVARLGREEGFAGLAREAMPCLRGEERRSTFALVERGYSPEQARAEARRCLQCDLRLKIGAPPLPPTSMLEFNAANVAQVPAVEGVYQLLDEGGQVLLIAGTANLRQALEEQLANAPDDPVLGRARYFLCEEDPMYTKRESELIQKYLQEHGRLPEGNDVLDDLF